jgi:hypothetical protein
MMPGIGTTGRKVRVDPELWDAAEAAAEALGTDRAAVMRAALAALVDAHAVAPAGHAPLGVLVRVDLAAEAAV